MMGWTTAIAAIAAFLITAVSGKFLIPYLRRLKYGQTILEIGPRWHKSKQGTPTMGGIMFIIGILAGIIIAIVTYAIVWKEIFSGETMVIPRTSLGRRIFMRSIRSYRLS